MVRRASAREARSVLGAMVLAASLLAADASVRSFRVVREKKHFAKNKKEGTKRASALRAAAEGKPSGPSARGERIVGEVVSRLRPSLSPPRRRRLVSPSLLAKKTPFFSLVRLTSPRAFRSERRDASSSPRPAPARGASESAARVASGDASARGVVEIEKNRQKTPRFVRLASGV